MSQEQAHNFNESSTKRIAKAVKKSEKVGSISANETTPQYLPSIHARLVAQSTTDPTKWSWQQVIRKADGTYEDGPLKSDLDSSNNLYFPAYTLNHESVAVGQRVLLTRLPERQTDGTTILKYAIIASGSICSVYITASVSTAKYTGTIQQGAATDFPNTGITNDGATVYVWNIVENGLSGTTPMLSTGDIVLGQIKGVDSTSSYPIVWTDCVRIAACTSLSSSSSGGSSSSSGG